MYLFIYLSKLIIFRTDIYIPVIQNCFIRIGGQINFNELNSIRSRYLLFSIWITHTHTHLFCIGGFSGRVAGLQPPPPPPPAFCRKILPPKKSFWSFLGLYPPPSRNEWWKKVTDCIPLPLPLQKCLDPPVLCYLH